MLLTRKQLILLASKWKRQQDFKNLYVNGAIIIK